MNQETQNEEAEVPKKQKRRFLKWLGRFVILVIIFILVGAVYEPIAEKRDAKAHPPTGQMVDVGGYKLHIRCTGVGGPTVVIESGWGDFSSSWAWVQPEVAKTTRVCTYDRAGTGWSELSPEPRTARVFARELHTLLGKAGEAGPYVLVGHSLGGYTMRVYAHDYESEVAGLVLVDAQALPTKNIENPTPAPKPNKSLFPAWLARVGMARLLAGPLGAIRNLPAKDKSDYRAIAVTPRYVQTFFDEGRGMSEGGAEARSVTTLGALPLIVLSRGKDQDAAWATSQAEYLKLSTNGQQVFADKSGHEIMIEQPEAAISSIIKMVEQVRSANQKNIVQ